MTNKYGTSNDFQDNQVLFAADLLDSIDNVKWTTVSNSVGTSSSMLGIMGHSSATWSVVNRDAIYNTTNSGSTWVVKSSGLTISQESLSRVCKADKTRAVVIGTYTNTIPTLFTSNSGSTWTQGAQLTDWGSPARTKDISYPTTTLITVAGNTVGTSSVFYSTDDAATWKSSNGPARTTYALDMHSGTIGYALDSTGSMWKTTTSAGTWTWTGHNITDITDGASMNAITDDKVIIATPNNSNSAGRILVYDNTTGTYTRPIESTGTFTSSIGVYKTANGNIFTGFVDDTLKSINQIYRSTDQGVTWSSYTILGSGAINVTGTATVKNRMNEYINNNMLMVVGNGSIHRLPSR